VQKRFERTAKNEALFREVNDRIEDLSQKFQVVPEHGEVEFHCECGRPGCDARVTMTLAEYAGIRAQDDRFAVFPGHETEQIEWPVERTDRYVIVDKLAEAEPFVGADGVPRSDG
jgi:hypothetical protein